MTSFIAHTSIDCADAYHLSLWWAGVLGYIEDPEDPNAPDHPECMIMSPDRQHRMLFIEVPEGKSGKNRLHFDLRPRVGSRDEELARILAHGARQVADRRNPDGTGWVVLADPQGNEFCLLRSLAEAAVAAEGAEGVVAAVAAGGAVAAEGGPGGPERVLRPAYPLRTARLLLRPLTGADAEALLAYRSRADVCRYVPFEPMTAEVIAARLAGIWSSTGLSEEGQNLTLGVELADTGQLIGDVILFWRSRLHGNGEVGWVLNPDFGGHGYATEAVRELLRLGFEELGLRRITARIDERNTPSARLAERLGMRLEARLVENEVFKGELSTELDFALLAAEWPALRRTWRRFQN